MTAAAFEYVAPRTADEAAAQLRRPGAVVLAGGQSLVRALTARAVRAGVVVDVNGVDGLSGVSVGEDSVVVGAVTRMRAVERDPGVAAALPVLAEAVRLVGHPQVRTRATVGGSLCQADPSAELPVVALALGASLRLRSATGGRTVSAEEFYSVPGSVREPGELLTSVAFPVWERAAVAEFSIRPNDLPLAVVCAATDGTRVRVAVGGVGDRPVVLPARWDGDRLEAGTVPEAGPAPSPVHGSREYRLALVRTLLPGLAGRLR